jgi:predicted transcriptional regulator
MESIATSVRITATAHALLSELAAETGKPKAQIVEEALRALEESVFWTGVQEAFAEPESKVMRTERELWDQTVGDGLKPRRKRK